MLEHTTPVFYTPSSSPRVSYKVNTSTRRVNTEFYCGKKNDSGSLLRSTHAEGSDSSSSWITQRLCEHIMSFNFPPPARDDRGRGRGRGQPPRSSKYMGGGTMKSGQGVFPIIPDDNTAFAFVEFIQSRGSFILLSKFGPGAP